MTDRGAKSLEILNHEGRKVRFYGVGRGDVPCFLIHGTGEGAYIWRSFANEISPYFQIFMPDLCGHGDSDWESRGQYSLDTYVEDIETIFHKLEIQQSIVIGHSLGGNIAAKLAEKFPQKVRALILVDSGPCEDHDVITYLCNQIRQAYRPYDSVKEYEQLLRAARILAPSELLASLARDSLRKERDGKYYPKFDIRVVGECGDENNFDWWSLLGNLEQRTLVVRGATSAVLSKFTAVKMANTLRKGTLATVSMSGHAILSDNPEGFVAIAKPFLLEVRRQLGF